MILEKSDKNQKKNSLLIYTTAYIVNIYSFAAGICWAWSSPAIPRLDGTYRPEENPLEVPATVLESSWIASLCLLGAATGPWLSPILTNRIGRKNTLLYSVVPYFISNLWLIFADTVMEFCIARFLIGVSLGCANSVIPMYLSELTVKEKRGSVGIFMYLQLNLSELIVFSIGSVVSLRFLSMFALISIIMFLIFFFIYVPESPYYFVSKNQTMQAEESLKKLRRRSDVKMELVEVIQTVEESSFGTPGILDLYTNKTSRKAFVVAMTLMFFHQATAISPLLAYLQTIFDSAGTNIPGDITAVIVGVTAFTSVIISISLRTMDRINRKTLLILSEIIMSIALFVLGIFFYLKEKGYYVENIGFLPILCVIPYFTAYNFGMGPVGWQIVGEIFPENVKALGTTFCTSFNIIVGFLMSVSFPTMSTYITTGASFWIYSLLSTVAIFFIRYALPETRNKSFLEIQHELRGEKL